MLFGKLLLLTLKRARNEDSNWYKCHLLGKCQEICQQMKNEQTNKVRWDSLPLCPCPVTRREAVRREWLRNSWVLNAFSNNLNTSLSLLLKYKQVGILGVGPKRTFPQALHTHVSGTTFDQ